MASFVVNGLKYGMSAANAAEVYSLPFVLRRIAERAQSGNLRHASYILAGPDGKVVHQGYQLVVRVPAADIIVAHVDRQGNVVYMPGYGDKAAPPAPALDAESLDLFNAIGRAAAASIKE